MDEAATWITFLVLSINEPQRIKAMDHHCSWAFDKDSGLQLDYEGLISNVPVNSGSLSNLVLEDEASGFPIYECAILNEGMRSIGI